MQNTTNLLYFSSINATMNGNVIFVSMRGGGMEVIMEELNFSFLKANDFNINKIHAMFSKWEYGKSFSYLSHARKNSGIFLIHCDEVLFTYSNGETLKAHKNDVLYIPEGCRYKFISKTCSSPDCYLVNFNMLIKNDPFTLSNKITCICNDSDNAICTHIKRIIDAYMTSNHIDLKYRTYKLIKLLYSSTTSDQLCLIDRITDYIDLNIRKAFSVEEIAKKFLISTTTLRRLFNTHINMSPIEYINLKKIEKAKELLLSPELPVNAIWSELGFYDAPYFYKVFKRITGKTPLQFRQALGDSGN